MLCLRGLGASSPAILLFFYKGPPLVAKSPSKSPIVEIVTPIAYSKTLLKVLGYSVLTGLYSVIPAIKEISQYDTFGDHNADLHTAFAFVLGLLLVFRTNAAYSRWWEARTLWGGLVNCSRNFAVKLTTQCRLLPDDAERARSLICKYAVVLKDHLRAPLAPAGKQTMVPNISMPHPPSETVQQIYKLVAKLRANNQMDSSTFRAIDLELLRLLDICGGCERIRNTRIIGLYRIFARQCIGLSLVTFPWGMADTFRWWTVPMTIIVAYFMIGLEMVAEEVEDPFGHDASDLDLDGLCTAIELSVNQTFQLRDASPESV
ncbi:bestrophin family protein [Planctomicrobium sp. SH527]|uniref:bestrophin family protein n=1 Tax=Planctomicrobium sp. SH527 TaxID=3448123 RepID=UPI003F5C64FA